MLTLDIALSFGASAEGGARMPLDSDRGLDDMISLRLFDLYVADVADGYPERIV